MQYIGISVIEHKTQIEINNDLSCVWESMFRGGIGVYLQKWIAQIIEEYSARQSFDAGYNRHVVFWKVFGFWACIDIRSVFYSNFTSIVRFAVAGCIAEWVE